MTKRIVLTGGGTGGHITPLLALAHELKKLDPDCYVIYIGERNGKYARLTANNPYIDEERAIFAGKFRRYHGESWLKRLFALKTNLLNARDFFLFVLGTVQCLALIKQLKPDIILLKGGFVGVPVGLAAAFWRLPFVTHDSDAVPGLANRLTGRWATLHATGMPEEYYKYPKSRIRYVGVLVSEDYQPVSLPEQTVYRRHLGLPEQAKVLLITGGSGGAEAINLAVKQILPELFTRYPDVIAVHQVGLGKGSVYESYAHDRLQVYELLTPMYQFTGSADVVITRAGANTMAELGVQGKACIVIPNPLLTGGHQLKNAQVLEENNAAIIVDEQSIRRDVTILLQTITELFDSPERREKLGKNLQSLTVPDAARQLAQILLDQGEVRDDVRP